MQTTIRLRYGITIRSVPDHTVGPGAWYRHRSEDSNQDSRRGKRGKRRRGSYRKLILRRERTRVIGKDVRIS